MQVAVRRYLSWEVAVMFLHATQWQGFKKKFKIFRQKDNFILKVDFRQWPYGHICCQCCFLYTPAWLLSPTIFQKSGGGTKSRGFYSCLHITIYAVAVVFVTVTFDICCLGGIPLHPVCSLSENESKTQFTSLPLGGLLNRVSSQWLYMGTGLWPLPPHVPNRKNSTERKFVRAEFLICVQLRIYV